MDNFENNIENEDDEIVTLKDEVTGEEVNFYVLAELDYKNKWYIYLEPMEDNENFKDGEIVIFELGKNDSEEEIFIPIENEKILQEVFNEFLKEMEK